MTNQPEPENTPASKPTDIAAKQELSPAYWRLEGVRLVALNGQLARENAELREVIESAKAAFGEHPDSEVNLAERIAELRDQARKPFHESTKAMQECNRLTAKVEQAKDALQKEQAYRDSELDKAHQQIATLRAKLDEARQVIAWYAEFAETTAINYDFGKRARAALALLDETPSGATKETKQ